MKALPNAARTKNYSGHEHCRWCDDTSQVIFAFQALPYSEEMAPCPFCEKGYRLEFGLGRDKDGNEYVNQWPQWGKDGFWRGRDWPLEAVKSSNPLPLGENIVRMKLLWTRYEALSDRRTENLPDPSVGLDPFVSDDQERLRLVQAELAKHPRRPPGEQVKTPVLQERAYGRCDDCHQEHDRWQYGKFTLCRACISSRQKVAGRLLGV